MKAVKRSELVVGNEYYTGVEESSSMILVKKTEERLYFQPSKLNLPYILNDGLIEFRNSDKRSDFYEVEPPIELSPESLATITTALRRYFDDYPIVKGSKEDDVINAIDELIEKFDIRQLEPLRDEMNKDLGFESNQESTTDPNEDRENDVEWNNRPNQIYKG